MDKCKDRRNNTNEALLDCIDDRNDELESCMCQKIKSGGTKAPLRLLFGAMTYYNGRCRHARNTLSAYNKEYRQNAGGENGKRPKMKLKTAAKSIINNIVGVIIDPADRFEAYHGNKTWISLQRLPD